MIPIDLEIGGRGGVTNEVKSIGGDPNPKPNASAHLGAGTRPTVLSFCHRIPCESAAPSPSFWQL